MPKEKKNKINHDYLRIAVVSDLHVGSKNPKNNEVDDYVLVIIDALMDDMLSEEVDYVILCGDNTNSSRIYQHEDLIKKLKKFEKNGIEVLSTVGNHDIETLKKEEFPKYYKNFGYADAYSKDIESLSFGYLVGDIFILMVDTDGYTDYRYAEIKETTLVWIETQLKNAKEHNWKVICVGHYPLLTSHVTEFRGREKMISLLETYNVPLYVSGHLHNRNVTVSDNLVELVVEKTTSYPCNYALIDIMENGDIAYTPKTVDIETWAKEKNMTDEILLNYESNGQLALRKSSEDIIGILDKDLHYSYRDRMAAADFFEQLMISLNDGTIYRNSEELLNHSGYPTFKDVAQGSNYGPWIDALFVVSNPYTEGFIIKDGKITK